MDICGGERNVSITTGRTTIKSGVDICGLCFVPSSGQCFSLSDTLVYEHCILATLLTELASCRLDADIVTIPNIVQNMPW